jgi:hypothetical protein
MIAPACDRYADAVVLAANAFSHKQDPLQTFNSERLGGVQSIVRARWDTKDEEILPKRN